MKFTHLPLLLGALAATALSAHAQVSSHTYTSVDRFGNVITETVRTPLADASSVPALISQQGVLGSNTTSSTFSVGGNFGGLSASYSGGNYNTNLYGSTYGSPVYYGNYGGFPGGYPVGGVGFGYPPPAYGYGYALPQGNFFYGGVPYIPQQTIIIGGRRNGRLNVGNKAITGDGPGIGSLENKGFYGGRNTLTPSTVLPGFSNSYTSNQSRR